MEKVNQDIETQKQLHLQHVIGNNLKVARQAITRLTTKAVIGEIWGTETSDRKNRLSEIENGARMPSPYVLLKLSMLYGVSLDFIFGLSQDIERDIEFSRAGMIVQGLRKMAIDMVDDIGMKLSQSVGQLPTPSALEVREHSSELTSLLRAKLESRRRQSGNEYATDIVLDGEILGRMEMLEAANARLSSVVTRHARIMELTVYDHIARSDYLLKANEYFVDHGMNEQKNDAHNMLSPALFDTATGDIHPIRRDGSGGR